MAEIDYTKLSPFIRKEKPDIMILTTDHDIIDVASIEFDENGSIMTVIASDESTYTKDEVFVITEFLDIPGIGFVPPGVSVMIDDTRYLLGYGWHTNSSGQNLCSWHLVAQRFSDYELHHDDFYNKREMLRAPVPEIRTLSKEMIDKITLCSCI